MCFDFGRRGVSFDCYCLINEKRVLIFGRKEFWIWEGKSFDFVIVVVISRLCWIYVFLRRRKKDDDCGEDEEEHDGRRWRKSKKFDVGGPV